MLRLKDIDTKPVIDLLRQFDLEFIAVEDGKEISRGLSLLFNG